MVDLETRPQPVREAASAVSRVTGLFGSVLTALVGIGILTAVQGDALVALLGAIPGLITLATTVLAVFGVVRRAEPDVTPVADPRNRDGVPLIVEGTISEPGPA
jgi:hypothetical protein